MVRSRRNWGGGGGKGGGGERAFATAS
jgi:hypothetical protein